MNANDKNGASKYALVDLAYQNYAKLWFEGNTPDTELFCAQFPDIADALKQLIAVHEFLDANPELLRKETYYDNSNKPATTEQKKIGETELPSFIDAEGSPTSASIAENPGRRVIGFLDRLACLFSSSTRTQCFVPCFEEIKEDYTSEWPKQSPWGRRWLAIRITGRTVITATDCFRVSLGAWLVGMLFPSRRN